MVRMYLDSGHNQQSGYSAVGPISSHDSTGTNRFFHDGFQQSNLAVIDLLSFTVETYTEGSSDHSECSVQSYSRENVYPLNQNIGQNSARTGT
jgi:hypothetical protein